MLVDITMFEEIAIDYSVSKMNDAKHGWCCCTTDSIDSDFQWGEKNFFVCI